MDDIPSNIVEVHDNLLNCVKTIEDTRKVILNLSTEISNRDTIRCKLRTHARLVSSYNKQVEKYWALIEEDAKFVALQAEFFQVTEAVDQAELDMHAQLQDFKKSFEADTSKHEETFSSSYVKSVSDGKPVVNDGASTSNVSLPVTEVSIASTSQININTVASTLVGNPIVTLPVTTLFAPPAFTTTSVTLPSTSGYVPPAIPSSLGLNPSAALFSINNRPLTTPSVQPTISGYSAAPYPTPAYPAFNVTQVQRTNEKSNVNITSSDISKLIEDSVQQQFQKLGTNRKHPHVNFHPNYVSTPGYHNIPNSVNNINNSNVDNNLYFNNSLQVGGGTNTSGLRNLPKFRMPEFSGEPGDYPAWAAMLDANILKHPMSASEKLTRLISLCKGRAHEAVKNCIVYSDHVYGLQMALNALQRNFGTRDTLNRAAYDKLRKRSEINGDYKSLSDLELDMCNYQMLMQSQGLQYELDATATLKMLFHKLPGKLRDEYVAELRLDRRLYGNNENGDFTTNSTFEKLLNFIRRAAEVANTTIGSINAYSYSKPKRQGNSKVFHSDENDKRGGNRSMQKHCLYCKSNEHLIYRCNTFVGKPVDYRRQYARTSNLCYNCLKKGHGARECSSKYNCSHCKLKGHHTLLCKKNDVTQSVRDVDSEVAGLAAVTTESVNTVKGCDKTVFHVIPIYVSALKGKKEIATYALLDQGSSSTLINPDMLAKIGVKGRPVKRHFTTINGKGEENCSLVSVKVRGFDYKQYVKIPNALTYKNVPTLVESIPDQKMVENYPHLNGINFPTIPGGVVTMILGVAVVQAHCALEHRMGPAGSPLGLRTVLGWSIGGPDQNYSFCENDAQPIHYNDVDSITCFHAMTEEPALDELLRRTYNEEFNDIFSSNQKVNSVDDDIAVSLIENSITKHENKYYMALPLRGDYGRLPNNRDAALAHLLQKIPSFRKDPKLFEWYDGEMKRYIREGRASLVPQAELHDKTLETWYLKHFKLSRGKPRVVADCSATYQGHSLNKKLLCGPDLLTPLINVLLGWREFPYAIMADIKSMFHCVCILPEYRRFQRFLWFENSDYTKPPVDYQFDVVVFGTISGPFCANYALQRCGEDNVINAPASILVLLKKAMYMDDFLRSFATAAEGKFAFSKLSDLLATISMHLTKAFGHPDILECVKPADIGTGNCNLSPGEVATKALGIIWKPDTDVLTYVLTAKTSRIVSRRTMLRQTASTFDPMGLICVFTLPAKILIQTLFARKLGWDQSVPEDIKEIWLLWMENIHRLCEIEISRCLIPKVEFSDLTLHVFCDASEKAYGCCAYIRINYGNVVHVSLAMGKSRVAPLKPMTIPKLELSACVVASNVAKTIKNSLTTAISKTTFWSDSAVVLQSLGNKTKRFTVFWKHRIQTIRNQSESSEWRYVPTKLNVADLCSRGLMPHQLEKARVWFDGPEWLKKTPSCWPENTFVGVDCEKEVFLPPKKLTFTINVAENTLMDLIKSTSNIDKLKKLFGWIIRFYKNIRSTEEKGRNLTTVLVVDELREAELKIITLVQHDVFADILSDMESFEFLEDALKRREIKTQNKLVKLRPILLNNVLRVSGRLSHAPLNFEEK